ncbi:unnamed protein product [Chrysoparadoxa australica]
MRSIIGMYCRARRIGEAAHAESGMREMFDIKPDEVCLGLLLDAYAKRGEENRMRFILDEMQAHDLTPPHRFLRYVRRRMGPYGSFEHPWVPPDPERILKRAVSAGKRAEIKHSVRTIRNQVARNRGKTASTIF